MKKVAFILSIAFVALGISFAQEETSGSADVSKVASRGADPNIIVEKRVNGDNAESKVVQPAEKGARSRGSYCKCILDNWTDWYVDFYVDGYYEGFVSKWSDGSVNVLAGDTKLYAVAEFDDGSKISWGPITKNCYNEFELEVYPEYYNWYTR